MKKPSVVLMGGFGNQLFQLAFSLDRYRNIPINLETSLASPRVSQEGNIDLLSYRLPSGITVEKVKSGRLARKAVNVILRISISHVIPRAKFLLVLGVSQLLKILLTKNIRVVCPYGLGYSKLNYEDLSERDLLIGYFQSSKFLSVETIETLKNMEYINEIDGFEKYRDAALTENPIIVHVRLGDYEKEQGIGILPNSYYLEALEVVVAIHPKSPIWIFSNDIPLTKQRFHNFHFEGMVYIDDNWNSASATFEIMRLGSAYVIANSSFSYWAAMLSRNLNPLVIAPKPWFQGAESPNQILPANWKTISTK
jgi:hypothetical protein